MGFRTFALRSICCLHLSVFVFLSSSSAQLPVPRFEPSKCAVSIPKGERVECGYLTVFENRTTKNDKTIRLPIIILKSDSPSPRPDPVLRTLGGPGGSSLRMVTGRRFSPWLKERDMIIFEQRGTKYAQPALECPEVGAANIESAKHRDSERTVRKNELMAVKRCYDRLVAEGIDLAAYNSSESAADIEDLRRVLKLEKINLYGVSYSARLMLEMMRDHPAGIRSVVLESVMPPEINYDEVGVDGIVRSLDRLFAECCADAKCAAAFPHLETDFYAVVKEANAKPIPFRVKDSNSGENIDLKLNGNDIITWLIDYSLSSNGTAIAAAPAAIYQVIAGNYAPLADYAGSKVSPPSYSLGMRYSVWCREEFPFEERKMIAEQSTRHRKIKGYEVQTLPAVCSVWKVAPADRGENQAVKSDIPTLILAGEYDAYTPPSWGKSTAANLKNSFFLEVPWVGHGPGFNSPTCLNDMVANFFNTPTFAPRSECLVKIEHFFQFVTKKL